MVKGYWIVHVSVTDTDAYKDYVAANAAAFARFGGHFLVRAGRDTVAEGALRERHVVIEFPSYEAALACYESPEYSKAKGIRDDASQSDLVIVEGYDGPQPGRH